MRPWTPSLGKEGGRAGKSQMSITGSCLDDWSSADGTFWEVLEAFWREGLAGGNGSLDGDAGSRFLSISAPGLP